MKRYALTAVGRDKPGIVAATAKVLYDHEFNIEDSSMTILQDEFAIILIMSAPDTIDLASLEDALHGPEGVGKTMGLDIHFKEIEEEAATTGAESTHLVTVSGYDKPGIVFKTAEMLANLKANITDLDTKIIQGEDKKIYIMLMEVFLPETIDFEAVEETLNCLGESLGVTIAIKPIESYEAL